MHPRGFSYWLIVALLVTGCASPVGLAPTATPALPTPLPFNWGGSARPLMMAHYMPWFQSKAFSGAWGWHWTMDFSVPSQADDGTWSKLAARYTAPHRSL